MSVIKTRFHLAADKVRGPQALELALEALSAALPYARITHVLLDHRSFAIATERFPDAIWQRLLANRAWHPKLVSHLVESLAESDPARRKVLQDKFYRLLAKPTVKVQVAGTLMYDDESTPGLLTSVTFPRMRDLGCKLRVEAFSTLFTAERPQAAPDLYVVMLQRQFYRDQVREPVARV